jgi:5-methylcytosine-specific restriction enzyme subunit McrC
MSSKIVVDEGKEFDISPESADFLESILLKNNDLKIHKRKQFSGFSIKSTDGQYSCKLSDYTVGIIHCEDQIITIKPRHKIFDERVILKMWMYVNYDLQNYSVSDEIFTTSNDSTMYDYIIKIFYKKLIDNVRNNLPRKYVEEFQTSATLHGRLAIVPYELQPNKTNFTTYSDDLTTNTLANQYVMEAWNKVRKRLFDIEEIERNEIFKINQSFGNISKTEAFTTDDLQRIFDTAAHLGGNYQKLIQYADIINQNHDLSGVGGSATGFTFLINYNDLFEEFVRKIVVKSLSCEVEKTRFGFTENTLDGSDKGEIEPDIIIDLKNTSEQGYDTLCIIDAKNKVGSSVTTNSDIYQIYTYSQMLNSRFNMLVYPTDKYKSPMEFEFTLGRESGEDHKFYRMFINLEPEIIKQSISHFVEELTYLISS